MEDFGLEFPVWTIGPKFTSPDVEGIFSVIRISDADCGSSMPLFTEVGLADRFVEQAKNERTGDYHTIVIGNPKSLCAAIDVLAQKGCRHVAFDCFIRDYLNQTSFVPVETVIEACQSYPAIQLPSFN